MKPFRSAKARRSNRKRSTRTRHLIQEQLEDRRLLAVLGYDGFEDYAPGAALEDGAGVGLNGGTNWQGNWNVHDSRRNDWSIVSGGLDYSQGELAIDGGDRAVQYTAAEAGIVEIVSRQATATSSNTVYLSMLYQNSVDTGGGASADDFLQLGLDNTTLANPRVSAMDRNTTFQVRSTITSTNSVLTGITSTAGQTFFLVLKAEKTGGSSTYNRIQLFVDPSTTTEPGSADATSTVNSGLNLTTAAHLAIRKAFQEVGDTYLIDEFRVGESYAEVVSPADTTVVLSSGQLTVTDANGASNDNLTLSVNGPNLRIHDPGQTLGAGSGVTSIDPYTVEVPLGSISSILVETGDGDDTLTIDHSNGDPIPSGGITFNGGSQATATGDALALTGGVFGSTVYTYTGTDSAGAGTGNDGTIQLDTATITYTGLEPISNTGTAVDAVFQLPAGADAATLTDSGASLTLDAATFELTTITQPTGSLTINGEPIDSLALTNAIDLGAASLLLSLGAISIDGGSVDAATQTFDGAVTLTADTTLTGGDVTMSSSIDSDGTARGLTVNASGVTRFDGNVGSSSPLASLTTDAAGSTEFGTGLLLPTAGAIVNFDSDLDVNTTDDRWSDTAGATVSGGTLELLIDNSPAVVFNGAPGSAVPGINSAYTYPGAVGGTPDSQVNQAGTQWVQGGTTTAVSPQSISPAPDTGPASFEIWFRPDDLIGDEVLWETGGGTGTSFSLSGSILTFQVIVLGAPATSSFDISGIAGDFIQAVGTINLATDTTELYVNGNFEDSGTSTANLIDWDGGDPSGQGTVGGANMGGFGNNSQGYRPFDGEIAIFRLYDSILTATEVSDNFAAVASPGAGATLTIQTTGDQTYNDSIVLGTSVTLDTAASVTFADTVDDDGNGTTASVLTVNAGGTTSFDAAIGAGSPLGGLVTNAAGTTHINGGSIDTAGDQVFNDAVTLSAATVLNGANVAFHGTLDSDVGANRALTVNTVGGGVTTFGGAVGSLDDLLSITTNSDGRTEIGGGTIDTDGSTITFNDAVLLTADLTITENGAGDVSFLSTVDSADGSAFALTVNTPGGGDTVFQGDVGSDALGGLSNDDGLGALTTDAAGELIFGLPLAAPAAALVNYDAGLDTNGPAIWESSTTDQSRNWVMGNNVTRNTNPNTQYPGIQAAYDFPASGSDNAGNKGVTGSFDIFNENADTSFEFWIQRGSSTANQVIWETGGSGDGSSLVLIGGNTLRFTIKHAANDLIAETTLPAGPDGEFLQAMAVYDRDVAGTDRLELFVDGTLVDTDDNNNNTNDWSGTDGAGIGGRSNVTGGDTASGGGLNFGTFQGEIAIFRLLSGALSAAAVAGQFDAVAAPAAISVTTTGDQTYNDAARLQRDVTINANDVTFDSTVDSGRDVDLQVNTSGDGVTRFNAAVGSLGTLGALSTNADGRTELSTDVELNGSGTSSLLDPVLLNGSVVINQAGAGDVTFGSTVDAATAVAADLTINTVGGGDTTFNSDVGQDALGALSNDAGLASLTTDASGALVFGPNLSPPTAGATLTYDAELESDGTWNPVPNVGGQAYGGLTLTAVSSGRDGITQAYTFDGSGGSTNVGLDDLTGDPTNDSASWELWFRPDVDGTADRDVLFETGGSGDGMAIIWDSVSGNVEFTIDNGSNQATASGGSGLLSLSEFTGEFHQVVATYDRNNPGTTDTLNLYINGVLVDSVTSTLINDWSGGDNAGLGTVGGSIAESTAPTTDYEGDLAKFRFYESVLSAADAVANFNSVVAQPVSVTTTGDQSFNDPASLSSDLTLVSGGSVSFGQTVDSVAAAGPADLTITATATTTFNGAVGSSGILDTVTVSSTDIAIVSTIDASSRIDLNLTGGAANQGGPITAPEVLLTGSGNFNLTNPGNNADTLAADVTGSGDVFFTDADSLTIGTVGGTSGVTAAGTMGIATVGSSLTVEENVSGGGDVSLTAGETAAAGDDLIVTSSVAVIESTGGSVTLRAGDDLTLLGMVDIDAATSLAIAADFDPSPDDDLLGGVTMADGSTADAAGGGAAVTAQEDILLSHVGASGDLLVHSLAGAIIDNGDTDTDLSGAGGELIALSGIGSAPSGAADPALETALSSLAAANGVGSISSLAAGDIRIANSIGGLLTITTVGSTTGVTNNDGDGAPPYGVVNISNASPLTVAAAVTAAGDIVLTAGETAAANFDTLTIAAAVTADNTADTAEVILNAGDDVTVVAGSGSVTSDTTITINIEESTDADGNGAADGIDLDAASGGEVTLSGSTGLLVAPDGTTIHGGSDIGDQADADIFNIAPQVGSEITIFGNAPVLPAFPGDTLNMDFTTLAAVDLPPTLTVGLPGDGSYSFPAGSTLEAVNYFSIEQVDGGGVPFHLVLDSRLPGSYGDDAVGDPDSTADEILVRLNGAADGGGTGDDLILERTGLAGGDPGDFVGQIFRGALADILSLTIEGSGDDETITIDDVNGLPSFAGTVPGSPDNPNIAALPQMLFNGRGGEDSLRYQLGADGLTDQTYALGDGTGGGFSSDFGLAEGEILTTNPGAALNLYFTGLEPISTSGTPGGTLTVLGDVENQLIQVIDADASTQSPSPIGADYTRVQAFNENRDVEPFRFAPYEFFDFEADAFTSLVIDGLAGDDVIDLISFAGEETGTGLASGSVSLLGSGGNDVISVNTNSNGTVQLDVSASGGDGDDAFVVADFGGGARVGPQAERTPLHAIDSLLGLPVRIDGGADTDRLRVDDSSQTTSFSYDFVSGATLPLAIGRGGAGAVEYNGTLEDVTLQSGMDSDTFLIGDGTADVLAAPGVTRIDDGGGDMDKIDFSGYTGGGVLWDMDSTAVQSLSGDPAAGDFLQSLTTIEFFVGSAGSDTVYIDPLAVIRGNGAMPIEGGPGEDTLIFDPQGGAATDSGSVISVPGFADITYAGFEDTHAVGTLPVLILDNTDVGFVTTAGFAPIPSQVTPFGGDIVASHPAIDFDNNAGTGVDVGDGTTDEATWTFSGIPNGWYAVAATWTSSIGQATDATYVVHDGAGSGAPIIGGAVVNQEQDPGDYFTDGAEWRPIDFVRVTSNSLTVSLSDDVTDRPGLSDQVLADAVRIELLPPSFLLDDGDPFPGAAGDPTFSSVSGTSIGPNDQGRFSDRVEVGAGGSATWTSASGLPAGTYLVSTSWVRPNTYSPVAPFSVNGGTAVIVNQDHSPTSFTLGGVSFEALEVVSLDGTAGIGGDTIEVVLTHPGGTRPVAADAILIQPISDFAITSSDGSSLPDGGLFDFGDTRLGEVLYETFTVTNTGLAPLELSDLMVSGTLMNSLAIEGGFEATQGFSATTLPAGASATFEVRFGPDVLQTNPGNPNHPTDPFLQGPHEGVLSFTTNAFNTDVELALAGRVGQPDAVILDNANPNLGSVYQDPNGGTFSRGGFTRFSGQQGYRNDVAFSAALAGNTATWDFTGVGLAAGTYQVAATWSVHPNRATNAPYTVTTTPNGATTVPVNQELAPNDFGSDGGMWEILGTFTVGSDGVLVVTLSDTANEFVIADAIRVQQTDLQVVDQIDELGVVDDGDLLFSTTGPAPSLFTYNGSNNALQNDLVFFPTNGGTAAQWDFHVDPGLYVVGVSYQQHSNRAPDAEYSITTPSGGSDTTVTLNQRIAASADQNGEGTVIIDGKPFQILTTISVPALDKEISLTLSDSGTPGTFLIADGAFVMRVADPVLPLMASAPLSSSPESAPLLTQAELDVAVAAAVDQWQSVGLSDRQQRALRTLDVRLAGLNGTTLGYASPTTGRVFIDRDAAGLGYGSGAFDLLSVVSHEIGHILGYEDDHQLGHTDVMRGTLEPGESPRIHRMPVDVAVRRAEANLLVGWPSDYGSRLDELSIEGDRQADETPRRDRVSQLPMLSELQSAADDLARLLAVRREQRRDTAVDDVFAEFDDEDEMHDEELL